MAQQHHHHHTADHLKFIELPAVWQRALLVVPVVLAITGAWFVMRWCVGNSIASVAPDIETAQSAIGLAPDDPLPHWRRAMLGQMSLLPEELPEALRNYEQAVQLSPNDYRLWMDLGRARALAGDAAGGDQALRRAVELAPSYALPRWFLGNLILRQNRIDDAFAELRRAGDADPSLRPQVFNLAWRVYGENVQAVAAAVGTNPAARAQLAEYLVKQQRVDDAERLWTTLSETERRAQREVGQGLMLALFGAKRFHAALDVYRSIAAEGEASAAGERLLNGSFEDEVGPPGTNLFGWQAVKIAQTQIQIDARYRFGGSRSLRIVFNAPSALDFRNVSQLIVIEPGTRYRLQHYVRTEDLKSGSTLITEIVDAADPTRVLAAAEPLEGGTRDWQPVTLEFTAPPRTEAITVRLSRAQCLAAVCPIFGKVWYDDFDFQRISAGASRSARADSSSSSRNSSGTTTTTGRRGRDAGSDTNAR